MMKTTRNTPSEVHLSVVDGVKRQKPIWCSSGLDLFVHLQVDSPESTETVILSSHSVSETPGHSELHDFMPQLESPQLAQKGNLHQVSKKEYEREPHEEPSGSEIVARKDAFLEPVTVQVEDDRLQQEEAPAVPENAARKLENDNPLPKSSSSARKRNFQAIDCESFSRVGQENRCDLYFRPRECKCCRVSLRSLQDWECQCLLQTQNGEDRSTNLEYCNEGLDEQFRTRSKRDDEESYRNRSPELRNYCTAAGDMDPADVHVTIEDEYEHDSGSVNTFSLFGPGSVNETVDVMEAEHDESTNFATWGSPVKNLDVDNFNVDEISAACQLLEMSCIKSREVFSEQELAVPKKERDACSLITTISHLKGLTRMVQKINSALPVIAACETANAVRQTKTEETWWTSEDSNTPWPRPRIVSANVGTRRTTSNGYLRTGFKRKVPLLESDSEILDRPPWKRQYKSIQDLVQA